MYAEYMYVQYLIPSPILNIPRNKPYLGPKSRDVQFYNMIQIPRKILATIQVPPFGKHHPNGSRAPTMSHLRNRRGLARKFLLRKASQTCNVTKKRVLPSVVTYKQVKFVALYQL